MKKFGLLSVLLGLISLDSHAQQYESVLGDAATLGTPQEHWFAVLGRNIAWIVDGDTGRVEGTMTLSMFTPAIEPHIDAGKIYSYGSFYTRGFYGDRTDLVLVYDLATLNPETEIEIPPKSAGIGHGGMIGLIDETFIGVWNITPAMSVSVVDVRDGSFVTEISTPGCAGVYPSGNGFFMPCGDGRVQYVRLDEDGEESARLRSDVFFDIVEDPIYDYAARTAAGWLFLSLEGHVFEVTLDGDEVEVSEPWSVNPPDGEDLTDRNGVPIEGDDDWRLGGRQPFAYNAEQGLLVTLMHQGGGPETFEDPGTEVWGFDVSTRKRGYRLALDEEKKGMAVQLTTDDQPLLLVVSASGGEVQVHDARTSRLLRTIPELGGNQIENLD
jgi:methylamine dehydrogenase heavy chain